jgi:predicted DCC family thiol-disulfide oxidoreductase YuxK
VTIHLNLYSTSHCHLCEQAEALLISLSAQHDIQWLNIEIADDAALLERYEIKIPVLKNVDTNVELAWPFTLQDIEVSFLKLE